MYLITENAKKILKKPQGKLFKNISSLLPSLKPNKKIIAIGDIVTISLIKCGILPFISVFDFKTKRKDLNKREKNFILKNISHFRKIKNNAGTISINLLNEAKKLLKKGGSLLIEGEEDLSALAFMLFADKNFYIIYGQPEKGVVLINCSKKTQRKAKKLLSLFNEIPFQ